MAETSLPENPQQPTLQSSPPPLNLSVKEWNEIADCAQALWAALECSHDRANEFRDLVESVRQRFERSLMPVTKRLDAAYHAESSE